MTSRSLPEHVSRTVRSRLARLEECLDFAHADDPIEALHDLRVSSRRLRAFADVFAPALPTPVRSRMKKLLRGVGRVGGALRDRDVQITLLTGRLALADSDVERAAVEHLLERSAAERDRESRRAEKRQRKLRGHDVAATVTQALDCAVTYLSGAHRGPRGVPMDLLEPILTEMEAAHPPDDGVERVAELHHLRLRSKKLRYALELFEPALGDTYGPLYGRAQLLQEILGMHRDLFVLEAFVEATQRDLEARSRRTLCLGLAMLHEELVLERHATFGRFRDEHFMPGEWRTALEGALLPRRKIAKRRGSK